MKKIYYSAFTYLILALASGVLFREFTKLNTIYDATALGKVHGHLFSLGFLFFLIVLLIELRLEITKSEIFQMFFIFYHIGLAVSAISMTTRGILTILEIKGTVQLSNSLDAALSGISGVGHIVLSIGLVIFMFILKDILFPKNEITKD